MRWTSLRSLLAFALTLSACIRTEAKPMEPKPPAPSESDDAIQSIEYSTVGGPEIGSDIHEMEWHLRVDFARSVVELRQHSPTYDGNPDAIGYFRAPLDPAAATRVLERARGVKLGQLPTPSGGGPGVSLLTLKIGRAKSREAASFASRDMGALRVLDPLLERLEGLLGKVMKSPLQAVELKLLAPPGPDKKLRFSLRNIGTMPLAIVDPRATAGEAARTGVRVAPLPPSRPGYTDPPLKWTLLPVVVPQGVSDKPVTLAPGATIDFETAPWKRAPGETVLAQAMAATYAGPPAVQGMPVIKGRLYSASVELPP